jgi:hypothetical protein
LQFSREFLNLQMEQRGIDELESIVKETRWNNKEAMRLFDNETKALQLAVEDPQQLGSDQVGSNLSLLNIHMHRVENKLNQISAEIAMWKQLNEGPVNTITENDVDEWHLREKDRRIDLYNALKEAISSQQVKELVLIDLKVKYKALQKDYKKSQHSNNENNARLRKLQEKYQTFVEKRKKRTFELCNLSAEATAKKRKVEESSSSGINVGRGPYKRKSPMQIDLASNASIFCVSGIPQHNLFTAPNGDGSATLFPGASDEDSVPDFIRKNPSASSFSASIPSYLSAKSSSSTKLSVDNNPRDIPSSISKTSLVKKAIGFSSDEHTSAVNSNGKVHKKQLGTLVGYEVRKLFLGHGTFTGKVTKFRRPYYTILYEDGDEEEMIEAEILKWIVYSDE